MIYESKEPLATQQHLTESRQAISAVEQVTGETIKDYNKRQVIEQLTANFLANPMATDVLNEFHMNTLRKTGNQLNEAPVTGSSAVEVFKSKLVATPIARALPKLIAFDLVGVKALTSPEQIVRIKKPRFDNPTGTVAHYQDFDSGFGAANPGVADNSYDSFPGSNGTDTSGGANGVEDSFAMATAWTTAQLEALGNGTAFKEMSISIDSMSVKALGYGLKTTFTAEAVQDMAAQDGLNLETELINILSEEMLIENNQRIVMNLKFQARLYGKYLAATGIIDATADLDGRYLAEKSRGLLTHIEFMKNNIWQKTRQGRGNWIVTTPDVASYLSASGMMKTSENVENSADLRAGTVNGSPVFVDLYNDQGVTANQQYLMVGYKGTEWYDAPMYYMPYQPLYTSRTIAHGTTDFAIQMKSRVAYQRNPFAVDAAYVTGMGSSPRLNNYLMAATVENLMQV